MSGSKKVLTTKFIANVAILSAVAFVLMMFDFPLLFIAPSFYKLDFSEVSVLIGGFAFGPWAAVFIEAVKIILKLLFKPTETMFVGELANFIICPAGVIEDILAFSLHVSLLSTFTIPAIIFLKFSVNCGCIFIPPLFLLSYFFIFLQTINFPLSL